MNEIIDVNLKILVKRIPVVRSQRWSGFGSLCWLLLVPLYFNSFPQSTVLVRVCCFKLFCHKNGKRVEVPGELYGSYDTDLYESQWTSKYGFLSKSRKEDLLWVQEDGERFLKADA